MGRDTVSSTVSATHDGSVVEGLYEVSEDHKQIVKTRRGDGGPDEYDHTDNELSLTLTFDNDDAAKDFIDAGEANLVLRERLFGGSLIDKTIKNVQAISHGKNAPILQDPGIGMVRIQARARFAVGDTYATMVTKAVVSS